jgi:hypothetical protein
MQKMLFNLHDSSRELQPGSRDAAPKMTFSSSGFICRTAFAPEAVILAFF